MRTLGKRRLHCGEQKGRPGSLGRGLWIRPGNRVGFVYGKVRRTLKGKKVTEARSRGHCARRGSPPACSRGRAGTGLRRGTLKAGSGGLPEALPALVQVARSAQVSPTFFFISTNVYQETLTVTHTRGTGQQREHTSPAFMELRFIRSPDGNSQEGLVTGDRRRSGGRQEG